MPDLTPIVGVAIQLLPGIFDLIRSRAKTVDPNAPVPDDAAVIAALAAAVASSVAQDDQWLAAHPTAMLEGGARPL